MRFSIWARSSIAETLAASPADVKPSPAHVAGDSMEGPAFRGPGSFASGGVAGVESVGDKRVASRFLEMTPDAFFPRTSNAFAASSLDGRIIAGNEIPMK